MLSSSRAIRPSPAARHTACIKFDTPSFSQIDLLRFLMHASVTCRSLAIAQQLRKIERSECAVDRCRRCSPAAGVGVAGFGGDVNLSRFVIADIDRFRSFGIEVGIDNLPSREISHGELTFPLRYCKQEVEAAVSVGAFDLLACRSLGTQ